MALIRQYIVCTNQVRVEGGDLVIDGEEPIRIDAANAVFGPVLTWGMQQGRLCFYVDGKLVKQAEQHEVAGLLRDISKAVSSYDTGWPIR